MNGSAPDENREGRGLLRWLGFGSGEAPPIAAREVPVEPDDDDPRARHRRQLLSDICSFLITHRLEVNAFTLAVAYDLLTGADPRLSALVEQRVARREPITFGWLEEASRSTRRNDNSLVLYRLMGRLESTIDDFGRSTTDARSATDEYNDVLQARVSQLGSTKMADTMIFELASIAQVMLDSTRELGAAMERSESRARTLRQDLDKARDDASRDHLTGLPNRRAFESVFETEYEAVKISGEALCVAFCDIDHFKRVNDTHGHEAGDRVLKAVAQTLSAISNDRCHVARHGGEEFVVLLRGRTLDEAYKVLDSARVSMAARRLVNRANDLPFGKITFSGGVADVMSAANPRDALRAADAALFLAKSHGRNRILRHELPEAGFESAA